MIDFKTKNPKYDSCRLQRELSKERNAEIGLCKLK